MTMLPLPPSKAGSSAPGERKAPDFGANPNRGLIYNKFVDKWPLNAALEEFQGLGEQKKEWVKNFTGGTGDGKELEKAAKRVCYLAKNLCRSDDPEPMIFHTKSPFLTGMGLSHPIENGFLWHHTLGCPICRPRQLRA